MNVFFNSSGVNLTFSSLQNRLGLAPRIQLNGTNSTFGSFFLLNEFCKKFKRLDVVVRFALSANASPKYKKTSLASVILKKQMCSFGRPLSLLVFVFNLKKTVRFALRLMLKKNLALIDGEFFCCWLETSYSIEDWPLKNNIKRIFKFADMVSTWSHVGGFGSYWSSLEDSAI